MHDVTKLCFAHWELKAHTKIYNQNWPAGRYFFFLSFFSFTFSPSRSIYLRPNSRRRRGEEQVHLISSQTVNLPDQHCLAGAIKSLGQRFQHRLPYKRMWRMCRAKLHYRIRGSRGKWNGRKRSSLRNGVVRRL